MTASRREFLQMSSLLLLGAGNSGGAQNQHEFSVGVNMTGVYQGSGNAPLTPSVQNFAYYTNFGMVNFRVPFAWSILQTFPPFFTTGIQPTAFGDLDTGYLAVLGQTITNAIAAGGRVLLDCHMFMTGPGGFAVGSSQVPTTALADMWGKIAAWLVANPALLAGIYGLEFMNEPPNGFPIATIIQAYNQCMVAVRNAGYTGDCYLDGTNFTSAWNWVSGQGNPFNSSTMNQIVDPLGTSPDKRVFTGHMYPDPNDSGTPSGYNTASTTPGSAPPGINTNPDIFVQRIQREFTPWSQQNGVREHIGEYGSGNDSPQVGGTFNYAAWDLITVNGMNYLKSIGVPITLWSAGPGFPAGFGGYFYSLDPFNSDLSGAQDFSSNGVQVPAIAVIQQFTSYSGSQPTAYAFFTPAFPSLGGARAVANVTTANFNLYYGGVIPSTVTFSVSVFKSDGTTPATEVTITPPNPTMAPGINGLSPFTFLTPIQDGYVVKVTNNAAWVNPPPVFVSSIPDDFIDIPTQKIQGVLSLTRLYSLYRGSTLIVLHPTLGTEVTLNFAANGGTDVATWQGLVGGASSAKLIRWFNQGPGGSNFDWTPLRGYAGASGSNCPNTYGNPSSPTDYPTLLFDYGDGKPAVVFTPPNRMYTNVLLANNTNSGVVGFTDLTLSGRILDTGTLKPFLLWQGLFSSNGPINWGPAGFGIREPSTGGSTVVNSTYLNDPGQWQTYGVTVQSNVSATTTNGLKMFLNEDLNNEADVPPYSFDPQFAAQSTSVGDSNYEAASFSGAIRSIRILAAAGQPPVSSAKMLQFSETDRANWGDPFTPPPPPAFSFPVVGVNNMGNSLLNGGPLNDYLGNTTAGQNGQVALWSGKLFNVFRLGFNWNTLQPTLQGPLDPTAMGFFQQAVDKCIGAGIAVEFDMHNFSGRGPTINSQADYGDLWGRLATWFLYVTNQDMLLYNTPNNEPGGGGLTQAILTGLNTACVAKIRAAGATGWVVASGLNFTKPTTYVTNGPAMIAAIADPLNKTGHDLHWYNDLGSQGTSQTAIPGAGNALKSACRMARQNNNKLFLGETGIANNSGMQTEGAILFQTMSDYRDVIQGWTPWVYGTEINVGDFQNLGPTNPAGPSVAITMSPHGDARFLQGTLSGVLFNWISSCDGGYLLPSTTLGTIVATLLPSDQNIKGATYTFTKLSDPAGLFTLTGSNLFLTAAPVDGTSYSLTIGITDNLGRSASTTITLVGAAFPYLDPNNTSIGIALSNADRTATFSTGAFGTRTTRGVPVGAKNYWETLYVSGAGGFVGVCNADARPATDTSTLSLAIPNQGSYVGFGYQSNGNMQPTFVGNIGFSYSATHTVCHALANINGAIMYWGRLDNGFWNGSPTANPDTGVGGVLIGASIPGVLYPYIGLMGNTQVATFRLKAADFAFTPPSTFSPII